MCVHDRAELDRLQRELRDDSGRLRADLRSDLRSGGASPAQARRATGARRAHRSSTSSCARAAGTAASSPTASRSSPSRRSSAANAGSISPPATWILSCLRGYCPSFVSVIGGTPRRRGSVIRGHRGGDEVFADLPTASGCRRGASLQYPGDRDRRVGSGHCRCPARHGGAPGGQGLLRPRRDGSRAEERAGHEPRAHREWIPRHFTPRGLHEWGSRPRTRLRHRGGLGVPRAWRRCRRPRTTAVINTHVAPYLRLRHTPRPRSVVSRVWSSGSARPQGATSHFIEATRLATSAARR